MPLAQWECYGIIEARSIAEQGRSDKWGKEHKITETKNSEQIQGLQHQRIIQSQAFYLVQKDQTIVRKDQTIVQKDQALREKDETTAAGQWKCETALID